ncbi:MAG: DUF4274 domain-containing protein [Clostridiales Family XIII bacterium]|jgi:hypothetical protein|nr:DUF4274 domain-containing protein [Clostridiales Family XIII bacterium]
MRNPNINGRVGGVAAGQHMRTSSRSDNFGERDGASEDDEMSELSAERKEFLNTHFYDGMDEPDRNIFESLSTPEELHYIAENHNWDDGTMVLRWIAESPLCSEATALVIFWRAQPDDFTKYKLNAKTVSQYDDMDVFDLIRTVLARYEKGLYAKTSISYDPIEDMPEEQSVPDIMFQPANGEEPYIHYVEEDVRSWFGEYLDSQISSCDTAMDLYNIAALSKWSDPALYAKILAHPLCDRGVALLVYWRLHTHCSLYGIADISKEIENKMARGQYQEVIGFDPKAGKDITITKAPKWTIPIAMREMVGDK